jgi:MYXO-CTERM domain-containing protein
MRRVAALALCAAACSAAPADRAASVAAALQGGTIDPDRATVAVVTHRSNVATLCSGSLIAPNVVVTARHCVAETPPTTVVCGTTPLGPSVSPSVIYVTTELTTDHSLPDDAGASYTVASIDVAPGGDDSCGFDLALLVLSSSIANATPYTPSFATLQAGDRYSALGYGETCGDANNELCHLESGARRRLDDLVLLCATGCSAFEIAQAEWLGQRGLCRGDSGGPALDAQGHLIGFGLRGELDANGNCTAPVYAAIARWKDFLVAAVRSASADAGVSTPPWATLQDDAASENATSDTSASSDTAVDSPAAPIADMSAEPPPADALDGAGATPPLVEVPTANTGCACALSPGASSHTPFAVLALLLAAVRVRRQRTRVQQKWASAPCCLSGVACGRLCATTRRASVTRGE